MGKVLIIFSIEGDGGDEFIPGYFFKKKYGNYGYTVFKTLVCFLGKIFSAKKPGEAWSISPFSDSW